MLGLLRATRGNPVTGFSLLALAIGLGTLSKGPVILLHLLPAGLPGPWWAPGLELRRWYRQLLVAVLHTANIHPLASAWDIRPMAWRLAALQAQHVPLARVGNYHGEYQFAGRLRQPLEVIATQDISGWFARNPDGRVLIQAGDMTTARAVDADFSQPYRKDVIMLVTRIPAEKLARARTPPSR